MKTPNLTLPLLVFSLVLAGCAHQVEMSGAPAEVEQLQTAYPDRQLPSGPASLDGPKAERVIKTYREVEGSHSAVGGDINISIGN